LGWVGIEKEERGRRREESRVTEQATFLKPFIFEIPLFKRRIFSKELDFFASLFSLLFRLYIPILTFDSSLCFSVFDLNIGLYLPPL
jgi:hypothetical protein